MFKKQLVHFRGFWGGLRTRMFALRAVFPHVMSSTPRVDANDHKLNGLVICE